jgi:hypothetical protein
MTIARRICPLRSGSSAPNRRSSAPFSSQVRLSRCTASRVGDGAEIAFRARSVLMGVQVSLDYQLFRLGSGRRRRVPLSGLSSDEGVHFDSGTTVVE